MNVMTPTERDLDPKWLEALNKSATHHLDGVSRDENNYGGFRLSGTNCAVCDYVGPTLPWHDCFLFDGGLRGGCCGEWWSARTAQENSDFSTFHSAELALYGRICAELERVRKIQAVLPETNPVPYPIGSKVWWDGMVMDMTGAGVQEPFPPQIVEVTYNNSSIFDYQIKLSGGRGKWFVYKNQLSLVPYKLQSTLEGLEPEEAAVLEWQQGLCSCFKKALWEAITRADEDNLDLLERGFPAEVKGYKLYAFESGWWQAVEKKQRDLTI